MFWWHHINTGQLLPSHTVPFQESNQTYLESSNPSEQSPSYEQSSCSFKAVSTGSDFTTLTLFNTSHSLEKPKGIVWDHRRQEHVSKKKKLNTGFSGPWWGFFPNIECLKRHSALVHGFSQAALCNEHLYLEIINTCTSQRSPARCRTCAPLSSLPGITWCSSTHVNHHVKMQTNCSSLLVPPTWICLLPITAPWIQVMVMVL